jgi:hypothetical protein
MSAARLTEVVLASFLLVRGLDPVQLRGHAPKWAPALGLFRSDMSDLVFLAASLVFFVVAVAYVHGCRSLKGGRDDA